MTDCRWILSKRISRSPKFQVVSHRDLEHDSFLVFYYDLHRLGDGVSDSAKCACPRTGFLVLRRHENRKQRSWRAHLSDTRYGDKEAPRGGGKKRRILTQLFVSPLTMVLYLCHNERDAENISCLRCFFRSDQWLEVGQRPACWWMRGSGRTKDDLA